MLTAVGLLACAASSAPTQAAETVEYEVFYHHVLRNKTERELTDVVVYLPVPASDDYQRIEGFRVERDGPVHISNRTDAFGTRIKRVAVASIPPKGEAHVGFSCVVKLGPPVRIDLASRAQGTREEIPEEIRELYTRDHPIFGLAAPELRELAVRLLEDHPDPARRASAIHDLVASRLRYAGGGGWDPAPEVLERGSGSCSEFCYLFCALCRATGIPTRFVGASIFPAKSKLPFQDHGNHRWAEAWLPGLGWTPFDPTLDRAKPAKQDFVGTHHGRTLIVTRTGDKSLQLGLSYVGANNRTSEVSRTTWFTWTQGTLARLADAQRLLAEEATRGAAVAALEALVADAPGSRAAREAQALLAGLKRPAAPDGGGR